MTASDLQDVFLDQLGLRLGDDMIDYMFRRFQEGGAAAAPIFHRVTDEVAAGPVRRLADLTDALGTGFALPADATEPTVQ